MSLAVKMPLYSRYGKIQKITTVPALRHNHYNHSQPRPTSSQLIINTINVQRELEYVKREISELELAKKSKEYPNSYSFKTVARDSSRSQQSTKRFSSQKPVPIHYLPNYDYIRPRPKSVLINKSKRTNQSRHSINTNYIQPTTDTIILLDDKRKDLKGPTFDKQLSRESVKSKTQGCSLLTYDIQGHQNKVQSFNMSRLSRRRELFPQKEFDIGYYNPKFEIATSKSCVGGKS